jgi:hypothetical protein
LLLLAVEAATFAPQALYVARHWDLFNGRTDVVLIFNSPEYGADPAATMVRQIADNVRAPWAGTNNTAQYSPAQEPQLDRATGVLVLIGMALTAMSGRLRRRADTWLWWSMLVCGWTFTQLLTTKTPNGARGIVYVPMLISFAAVAIDEVLRVIATSGEVTTTQSIGRRLAAVTVCIALVLVAYTNVRHYVDWQAKPHTRFERYLYVTTREFPQRSAAINTRAMQGLGIINVEQWRTAYPVRDWADPFGESR